MAKIEKVYAREILDSRGNPTVEVEVTLEDGVRAIAAVPSGASTGSNEALELRDEDKNRYGGKGVLKAVANVNEKIAPALIGMESANQREVDGKMLELDGTENKTNLGANAILGVSLAVCRATAINQNKELYRYIAETFGFELDGFKTIPMFNILNGGEHSDSGLSIQEFKLVPQGITGYAEQLRAGSEVFFALKKILASINQSTAVGDEGGFAPRLESNSQALEVITQAILDAGYKPGVEVFIALDAAANSFYEANENQYFLKPEKEKLSKENLINLYKDWIDKYNIMSVEDGLAEGDWEGWRLMNEKIGDKVMTIGDDLLVTNVKMVKKAIEEKACNSVLIKVNQIGTLSETIDCMNLAKENNMKTVVSHRSGETTDDFIADLAIGAKADFIKTGSLSRGERICKYNRLLRINEQLAS
ncbi:MAG TPA: phosphopyruvate hydratase [Candidatus Moranbacteria bacterium]|nr:MAG: Enolase [Candidatus Moranbacteria bacterium GW2011_GWF1_34_10]HBI17239.1 phosphopyruvate hydratase [Candidatus Moranbacteria bacterium]